MVATNAPHSGDPGKVETTVSEACTRSGAFALLLTVVLFLLAMYWIEEKRDEAAAEYVADRINLAMYLDTLDEDRIWQEYERTHPDAESMPMSQLLHVSASIVSSAKVVPAPKPAQAGESNSAQGAKPPAAAQARPAAPTNLTGSVAIEIYEMAPIHEFLGKLNDSRLLTRGIEASNFFEFSIVKWAQKREGAMYANLMTGVCLVPALEVPRTSHVSAHYIPQLDTKAMYDCLTLHNVRDLAKFELPSFPNPSTMGRRVAQDSRPVPGFVAARPVHGNDCCSSASVPGHDIFHSIHSRSSHPRRLPRGGDAVRSFFNIQME